MHLSPKGKMSGERKWSRFQGCVGGEDKYDQEEEGMTMTMLTTTTKKFLSCLTSQQHVHSVSQVCIYFDVLPH